MRTLQRKPYVVSFTSYKGGSGRTTLAVHVAEALVIQGLNVLIIDLDLEAPGVTAFSRTATPSPLFQPGNLFPVRDNPERKNLMALGPLVPEGAGEETDGDAPEGTRWSDWRQQNVEDHIIPLPGLADCVAATKLARGRLTIDEAFKGVPVYECRSSVQHPVEGRLFVLPVGGHYSRSESAAGGGRSAPPYQGFSDWTFFPPLGKSIISVLNRDVPDLICGAPEENTIEVLINAALEGIGGWLGDESGSSGPIEAARQMIDYVIVDLRPGSEEHAVLTSLWSDGMVGVVHPATAPLTGLENGLDILFDLQRPEGVATSTFQAGNPPTLLALAAQKVGSLAQSLTLGDRDQKLGNITQAIFRASRFDEFMGWVERHSREGGASNLLQVNWPGNRRKLRYYYDLAGLLYSEHRPNSSSPARGATEERLEQGMPRVMWRDVLGDDRSPLRPIAQGVIPFPVFSPLMWLETMADLRRFVRGLPIRQEEDEFVEAVFSLAGHIRDVASTVYQDLDPLAQAARTIADDKGAALTPWGQSTGPWQRALADAMIAHRAGELLLRSDGGLKVVCGSEEAGERKIPPRAEEQLKAALHGYAEADRRLAEYLLALPMPNAAADWKGLWIIHVAKASINDLFEFKGDAITEYKRAVEALQWEISTARPNAANSVHLQSRITEYQLRLAKLNDEIDRVDDAAEYLGHVIAASNLADLIGIADTVIDYCELRAAEHTNVASKLLAELRKKLQSALIDYRLRDAVVVRLARTLANQYWISGTPDDLFEALKYFYEWYTSPDRSRARLEGAGRGETLAVAGLAYLDCAAREDDSLCKQNVAAARDLFEESALFHFESVQNQYYLALARHLDLLNQLPSSAASDHAAAIPLEQTQDPVDDRQIRERDAFYAFEQCAALLLNCEDPGFFFDATDALVVATNLGGALRQIAEHSTIRRAEGRLLRAAVLDRIFARFNLASKPDGSIPQILTKVGLIETRTF